uniref:Zinc finger protein GIS2 n=1 Tax=Anthurium amnicola TaxID=1678845 RepID=A0A1D1Z253_9ARAE
MFKGGFSKSTTRPQLIMGSMQESNTLTYLHCIGAHLLQDCRITFERCFECNERVYLARDCPNKVASFDKAPIKDSSKKQKIIEAKVFALTQAEVEENNDVVKG